jgi:hypothetical protein
LQRGKSFRPGGKGDADNQPKLGQQEPDGDAFKAAAQRHPYDRQKQHVEQLQRYRFAEAQNQHQCAGDRGKLQDHFE